MRKYGIVEKFVEYVENVDGECGIIPHSPSA